MPQRQGDANNPSCRGAGDQIEIRSNRAIEVLFQFRQEGCRKRAENAPPRQYTGGGASFAPAVRLLLPMAPPHVWASRFRPRHSRPSQRSPTGPLPPVAATASPVRACDSSFPLRTRRPCALSFRALLRTSQTVGLSWDHCAVPVFHHISTCRHASSTTYMIGSFFALSMEDFDIIC